MLSLTNYYDPQGNEVQYGLERWEGLTNDKHMMHIGLGPLKNI